MGVRRNERERTVARLLKAHPADEEGVWEIRGEDDNTSLAGSHIEPLLATVEGRYGDVVEQAVRLPRFFSWGSGGSVRKVQRKVLGIDGLRQLRDLHERRRKLADELEQLDREIRDLEGSEF